MTEQSSSGKPTLLVVEDDEDMVTLLRFLLEREGYELFHAADGWQAQILIETIKPPALVLLDVMLPHVSGLRLVTHIRAKAGWREVPIVMLTADGAERDVVYALDAGADDYVVKPFNPKELVARLRRLLQKGSKG
ncbi:MAG: two-component system response regulator [Nitrospiraceae bacterium]